MNIIKDDSYEEIAATYQCLEIDRLNEVLKHHGITDVALRRKICKSYIFDSGNFLDGGWFKSGDTTVYPELCFAERELTKDGLQDPHTLYMADFFSFHEYAGGDISWYFEEHNEDASEIENGCV